MFHLWLITLFGGGGAALGVVLLLMVPGPPASAAPAQEGEHRAVVVLVNSQDPDSIEIGRYYAGRRGIPEENILALPLPLEETISRETFVRALHTPLQDLLIERGWIEAFPTGLRDDTGRRRYGISRHRIAYLVVCRGVPLRIAHDPRLLPEATAQTLVPQYRTNAAAVDSELSLLARSGYAIHAFLPNPLYRRAAPLPAELASVVRVARLDGPAPEDVRRLVDRAMEAEATGLHGRGYIDLGGPHRQGEVMLESVASILEDLGFDLDVDRGPRTFSAAARFDAPIFYFGWYEENLGEVFLREDFRFPPGAIAMHIHSFSGATLRSNSAGWCGPLIARGATATLGNVFEPYLDLTHKPDLLIAALAGGATFGEAVYHALPVLSWQSMAIGDPLYRPFGSTGAGNWEQPVPEEAAPYRALRRVRLLLREGRADDALREARAAAESNPGWVSGLELARLLVASEHREEAAATLDGLRAGYRWKAEDAGYGRSAAQLLERAGRPESALAIYRELIALTGHTPRARMDLLAEGIPLAQGSPGVRDAWRRELVALQEAR